MLDTTTSFAATPDIRATIICQYPSPVGFMTGTRNLAATAAKLSDISPEASPCGPRFSRNQRTIDARNIVVPAFVR